MFERIVRNPIYANLLMYLVIGVGLLYLFTMRRETFPNFSLDRIVVTVESKGESPEDIEEGICIKIEEEIQGIEGIRKIRSTARESVGTVVAELDAGTSQTDRILNEVKSRVERIDFPERADKPVVTEVQVLGLVLQLAISGEVSERILKELAEDIRKEILALPNVSQVRIVGTRDYQVSIEVSEENLRRTGLSFEEIVVRIREQSLNLPAGALKAEGGEITIRTVGRRRTAEEFESIVLRSDPLGGQVTLGQIARVTDGFEESGIRSWFTADPAEGQGALPAVQILVFNTSEEDVLTIAEEVRNYVDSKRSTLPAEVEVEVWVDIAGIVEDRIDLLLTNGIEGLLLVAILLLVFLGPRLALWVSLGVPVSILGTFAILHLFGHTINLPSTFALILVLGMLVDDAIVVGENVFAHWQRGKHPIPAAIDGATEVALPVIASSATTAIAFCPILFVEGDLGKVMGVMGIVVIGALAVSLVECLLILPPHLAHSLSGSRNPRGGGFWNALRGIVDDAQNRLIAGYGRLLGLSLRYRGATIGICASLFLLSLGMIRGGWVKFTVFSELDVDYVRAQFELPPGTPPDQTTETARRVEEGAQRLDRRHGGHLVERIAVQIGQHIDLIGEGQRGDHLGEVVLALAPNKFGRPLTSEEFLLAWRDEIGSIPAIERIEFGVLELSPAGRPIEIRLIGEDFETLRRASTELQEKLKTYPGVLDITDDHRLGKLEYQFSLRHQARGFTVADLANQLRQGFLGEEAVSLQRRSEEIAVVISYPSEERRRIADLDHLRVRNRAGQELPIELIAERNLVRRPDRIHRSQGDRAITVSARIDPSQANAEEVLTDLEREFLDDLKRRNPGLRLEFAGQRGQSEESVASLFRGLALALLAIYILLAFTFRSYVQPIVIMATLPLSLFGAVVGHWVMGWDLSLTSLAGFVGLAGIIVNDSLILVEFINDSLSRGKSLADAIAQSGASRFRPILLTSITTFAGLLPILLEKSGQAKAMIPMAITVSFGLIFATAFVLILVPALIQSVNDLRRAWHWIRTGRWPAAEEVEPAYQRGRKQENEELAEEEEVSLPEEIGEGPLPDAIPAPTSESPHAEPSPERIRDIYVRSRGPDRLVRKALRRVEEDDPSGALTYYLAALLHDPRRSDLHMSVGMLRSRLGDWHGAAASFEEVLELEPTNQDAREYRAWAHLRSRQYSAAVRDFSEALAISGPNLIALKGRATALLGVGKAEEAISDFTAALGLSPQNADLYFLRGNALRKAAQYGEAVSDYSVAIERSPRHALAFLNRGRCQYALEAYEAAIEDLDQAHILAPDITEVLFHRGRTRLALKHYRSALEDLTAFLALDPSRKKVHLLLGQCRDGLGDTAGACTEYRTYLDIYPQSRQRRVLRRYIRESLSKSRA